jgi:hypothetical protein
MWAMFLSSYLPLFLLLGLRSIGHSKAILIASGVLVIAGSIGTIAFLLGAPQKSKGAYELLEVENRDSDVVAYVATYLLPFLTVFSASLRDVLSLLAFIAIICAIYVRSRLIYVNPVLALLGFRLWRVIPITPGTSPDPGNAPWPRFLLADKAHIRKGQVIIARRITDDLLYLEREDDEGD